VQAFGGGAGILSYAIIRNLYERGQIRMRLEDVEAGPRGGERRLVEHMRELDDDRKKQIRKERNACMARVMDVFWDGMDQGLFRRQDVRIAALCLLGICNWAYQWYRPGKDSEPAEMAAQCWNVIAATRGRRRSSRKGYPPAVPRGT
jgi:hypothetical protein